MCVCVVSVVWFVFCSFLQYFDTVGWVFWPVKTVSHITYTVLGGTLNTAQSNPIQSCTVLFVSIRLYQYSHYKTELVSCSSPTSTWYNCVVFHTFLCRSSVPYRVFFVWRLALLCAVSDWHQWFSQDAASFTSLSLCLPSMIIRLSLAENYIIECLSLQWLFVYIVDSDVVVCLSTSVLLVVHDNVVCMHTYMCVYICPPAVS